MKLTIKDNFTFNKATDIQAVLKELDAELSSQLSGLQIQSVKSETPLVVETAKVAYKAGFNVNSEPDTLVTVLFPDNALIKGFALERAFKRGIISTTEVIDFTEVHEKLPKIISQLSEIEAFQAQQEREAIAEQKRLAALEEQELKYKAKVEASTQALDHLETLKFSSSTFYYNLGWLAANAKTLSAAVPDWAVNWFRKSFGDAKCTITDSKKIGPSGYTSQWLPSFTLTIANEDLLPPDLRQYRSKTNTKKLANTKFLYTLATDFGFKFGKQDINEIRKTIPSKYIADFDAGANK